MEDQLLTPNGLASRLKKSEKTLENWRRSGTGPPFVRVGRAVRYRASDVDRWLAQNTTRRPARGTAADHQPAA